MKYATLLNRGKEKLKSAGIEEYENDAYMLLEYVTGKDRNFFILNAKEEASDIIFQNYEKLCEKRSKRIPLQYITGKAYFCGYEFYVDENVLIPRFDTENLVCQAEKYIKENSKVLDVCTGSGCIIISLYKNFNGKIKAKALDISEAALKVAKKNAQDLECSIDFIQSDVFENIPQNEKFDLIVSNPPYIKTEVIDTLMPEVKKFEPVLALDGLEDGLYFYRKISKEAVIYLNPKGRLVFEIGADQRESVTEILKENGYKNIECIKDLNGLDRVITGEHG
ncbi:release factor glutamine methyltransferase [Acetitomaculum ruminis DSM 5522]|uniref:Release factor glutamine methyltransferase n=1 Tax=Acetitomaculum ruminis DSM 5522 TaxID=1120918 RepID=A0A1I1AHY5_9FIRM|nr:peptide chain release factor N(5)-glutamine methyltransferase [Acetitomaculum ruminis]SFB37641.1 release factor glutamine methyltransferase [Acetitomaculum ruminis DSM 5522]